MFRHNKLIIGPITDVKSKFSKTPPPSPVDLTLKEKTKIDDGSGDKLAGLQPKGIISVSCYILRFLKNLSIIMM